VGLSALLSYIFDFFPVEAQITGRSLFLSFCIQGVGVEKHREYMVLETKPKQTEKQQTRKPKCKKKTKREKNTKNQTQNNQNWADSRF